MDKDDYNSHECATRVWRSNTLMHVRPMVVVQIAGTIGRLTIMDARSVKVRQDVPIAYRRWDSNPQPSG